VLSSPLSYTARVSLEVGLNRVDSKLSWFPQFLLSGRSSRLSLSSMSESSSLDLPSNEGDTLT
jgi:hypothetical protein